MTALDRLAADALAAARARRRTPGATYRLQFHAGFTLRDALALVPYFHALGVTHLYASPLLTARPGSIHGYDITDHDRLNPEVGTESDLAALSAALRARGMGLILDVVPNHMSVAGDNAWWADVLEHGPASPFAGHFDIAWYDSPRTAMHGRLLLPVLGDPYGAGARSGPAQAGVRVRPVRRAVLGRGVPARPADVRATPRARAGGAPRRGRRGRTGSDRADERTHRDPPPPAPRRRRPHAAGRRPGRGRRDQAASLGTRWPVGAGRGRDRRRGDRPGRHARRPGEFRGTRRTARSTGVPLELLAGGVGRDQLPPVLRRERAGGARAPSGRTCSAPSTASGSAGSPTAAPTASASTTRTGCSTRSSTSTVCSRTTCSRSRSGCSRRSRTSTRECRCRAMRGSCWRCSAKTPPPNPLPQGERGRKKKAALLLPLSPAGGGRWGNPRGVPPPKRRRGLGEGSLPPLRRRGEDPRRRRGAAARTGCATAPPGTSSPSRSTGCSWTRPANRPLTDAYKRFTGRDEPFHAVAHDGKLQILKSSLASELWALSHQLDRLARLDRRSRDFTLNGIRRALREVIACFPVYRSYVNGGASATRQGRGGPGGPLGAEAEPDDRSPAARLHPRHRPAERLAERTRRRTSTGRSSGGSPASSSR